MTKKYGPKPAAANVHDDNYDPGISDIEALQFSPPDVIRDVNNHNLLKRIELGLSALFTCDSELFTLGDDGIHEQTITFRLGLYMQTLFSDFHVDCEYNRVWDKIKRTERAGIIKPDIIIHRRMSDRFNLFCLEAKKHNHWDNDENGFKRMQVKLTDMTYLSGEYAYRLGLAWKILPSQNIEHHEAYWFYNGMKILQTRMIGFVDEVIDSIEKIEKRDKK